MSIVEIDHLTKIFNGCTAVDDISFELPEGRITGLLGPNGAGKTTTIYMMLGLITSTAGSIRIFGKDIQRHRQEILGRMNFSTAYVSLPSNMKIWENLRFFSYLYDVPHWTDRADHLLKLFELSEFKHKKSGELSSGQSTRLNMVKSLLNSPCFLCLDEPTASLDPASARIVRRQLQQIAKQDGVTILYTSHNMHEVEEICEEVIFLHHGKIKARTTPAELVQQANQNNLEDAFLELAKDEV
jgi:ABC-2 type transport system ATP-binding protein